MSKKQTTIYVDIDIQTKVRQIAATNNITYSQQCARIVEEYIQENDPDPRIEPAPMKLYKTSDVDKVRIVSYVTPKVAEMLEVFCTKNEKSFSSAIATFVENQLNQIENQ